MIGRFQPLHNGHMAVIRKCAAESENLTIGIGSAQYSHDRDNPFTAGERYLMINEVMKEEGITNYCIVPIEDINRYSLWVAQVESLSPPFTRVYSNNPLTRRLFSEAGYELRDSPLYNREVYSGTVVRQKMVEGDDWRELVPGKVAEIVDYIDGVRRLRDITGGE
jgi:nicotinamide-nucleotide adenylyltransferase